MNLEDSVRHYKEAVRNMAQLEHDISQYVKDFEAVEGMVKTMEKVFFSLLNFVPGKVVLEYSELKKYDCHDRELKPK